MNKLEQLIELYENLAIGLKIDKSNQIKTLSNIGLKGRFLWVKTNQEIILNKTYNAKSEVKKVVFGENKNIELYKSLYVDRIKTLENNLRELHLKILTNNTSMANLYYQFCINFDEIKLLLDITKLQEIDTLEKNNQGVTFNQNIYKNILAQEWFEDYKKSGVSSSQAWYYALTFNKTIKEYIFKPNLSKKEWMEFNGFNNEKGRYSKPDNCKIDIENYIKNNKIPTPN